MPLHSMRACPALAALLPKDSVANHGAGVGSWGSDASVIEDSSFERLSGLRWGGAMLMEEHARTEFHRCWFSHCYSPYGGILDDGGEASPAYVDCVFDHGTALHGSHYYAYGHSSEQGKEGRGGEPRNLC